MEQKTFIEQVASRTNTPQKTFFAAATFKGL